jgi:hypothetical protein
MRKHFRRNLVLFALALGSAGVAYASTLASAQGPVFQGSVTAPAVNLSTAQSISTCVGDGGFTNCTSAPQLLAVSALQAGTCTSPCTLLGSQGALADGGAALPGLSSTTVIIPVSTIQQATGVNQELCTAAVQAPGGDGGDVLITCGPDAGTAVTYIRLN